MVIVFGIIEVDHGDRGRYLAGKASQVAATRAEDGCVEYTFAADADDPGRVRLVERWESMADLEAHVATVRAAPAPAQTPVPSRMVSVEVFEAEAVRPPWA